MSHAADMLQGRAEVLKLARLLGLDPDQLAYLEPLPADDLRALRDGITEVLYDGQGGSLRRLAAASRLLPAGLTAILGQRAFGPLLSARLAGMLDPDRAIDVAGKLPPPFLADVASELDPRRASALIGGLSPELIAAATAELVARGEYVTMGRFVGHLSDPAVAAAVSAMDDRALLEVAFVLEDKDQVGRLLSRLPPARAAGIIRAAADGGLWVQALDLLKHLSARQRRDMAAAALALEDAALQGVLEAVIEHELWDEALLIAEHDDTVTARLVARLEAMPAKRRRAAAARAREDGALDRLGVLGQALAGA
ncbi:MAG TPA: hypothetical protein VHX62_17310 [Solirubrobacteraceae bacterium]|jgi:hypothetical protein|nr:hypothetical protein [Solirubrobacteraceae bacterium]